MTHLTRPTYPQDESNTTVQVKSEPEENVLIFLEDLVGNTFLMDHEPDGQQFRARIAELVDKHEGDLVCNPKRLKFLC